MTSLHQVKEKTSLDKFCEKQAFLHLLSKGKFGYNVPADILISLVWYLIKGWLILVYILRQMQIAYADFARSVYGQHHLGSSINFAMHKVKPDTLTAGTV